MIWASVSGDRHASGAVFVMRIALWDTKFFPVLAGGAIVEVVEYQSTI